MKRVTVLRHAKSSWDNPDLDDFNRPLNDRGRKAARRIGMEMTRRGMHFDLVLASPAPRVRETLDAVREKFRIDCDIRFEPRMYGADGAALLSFVQGFSQTVRAPLLVGHNPGLERLLVGLTHDDEQGLRSRIAGKYPTAALAVVDLPAQRWEGVEHGSGEIVELIVPHDLD